MKKLFLSIMMLASICFGGTKSVVPGADGEGSLGTSSNAWGNIYAKQIMINGTVVDPLRSSNAIALYNGGVKLYAAGSGLPDPAAGQLLIVTNAGLDGGYYATLGFEYPYDVTVGKASYADVSSLSSNSLYLGGYPASLYITNGMTFTGTVIHAQEFGGGGGGLTGINGANITNAPKWPASTNADLAVMAITASNALAVGGIPAAQVVTNGYNTSRRLTLNGTNYLIGGEGGYPETVTNGMSMTRRLQLNGTNYMIAGEASTQTTQVYVAQSGWSLDGAHATNADYSTYAVTANMASGVVASVTSGFVTASITNGILSSAKSYTDVATQNLVTASVTNGILSASKSYTDNATQGLVTASITNGILSSAKSYTDSATQGLVTASITNGILSSSKTYTDNATNNINLTDAQHGQRGGSNIHALADTSAAGFMSVIGYNTTQAAVTNNGNATLNAITFTNTVAISGGYTGAVAGIKIAFTNGVVGYIVPPDSTAPVASTIVTGNQPNVSIGFLTTTGLTVNSTSQSNIYLNGQVRMGANASFDSELPYHAFWCGSNYSSYGAIFKGTDDDGMEWYFQNTSTSATAYTEVTIYSDAEKSHLNYFTYGKNGSNYTNFNAAGYSNDCYIYKSGDTGSVIFGSADANSQVMFWQGGMNPYTNFALRITNSILHVPQMVLSTNSLVGEGTNYITGSITLTSAVGSVGISPNFANVTITNQLITSNETAYGTITATQLVVIGTSTHTGLGTFTNLTVNKNLSVYGNVTNYNTTAGATSWWYHVLAATNLWVPVTATISNIAATNMTISSWTLQQGPCTNTSTGGFVGNGASITNVARTNLAYEPSFSTWCAQTQVLAQNTHYFASFSNVLWDTESGFVAISNLYKITTTGKWEVGAWIYVSQGSLTNGSDLVVNIRSKAGSAPTTANDGASTVESSFDVLTKTYQVQTPTTIINVTNNLTYIWVNLLSSNDGGVTQNTYNSSAYSRFWGRYTSK